MAKFKNGQEVTCTQSNGKSQVGEVSSYSKGWYTVELADGTVKKFRESKLSASKGRTKTDNNTDSRDLISKDIRSTYTKYKPVDGKPRFDCGDDIAMSLRGIDRAGIVKLAAKVLGTTKPQIEQQYGHLNNGQIRMCLGVRIRGVEGGIDGSQIADMREELNV